MFFCILLQVLAAKFVYPLEHPPRLENWIKKYLRVWREEECYFWSIVKGQNFYFQVKELEGVGGVSGHSAFVVVDHLALIRRLNIVRRIVDAKKFVVVIPSSGELMLNVAADSSS